MGGIQLPALGIRPPQQEDLLSRVGKLQALQGMGQQQEIQRQTIEENKLGIQAKQQDMKDSQTVMQTLGKYNGDLDAALPELSKSVQAKTLFALDKYNTERKEQARKTTKEETEAKIALDDQKLGLIDQAHQLMAADPSGQQYQQAYPQLAQAMLKLDPSYQGKIDPSKPVPVEALDQLKIGLMTDSVYEAKEKTKREIATQQETARHNQAMEENNVSEAKLAFRAAQGDPDAIKAMQILTEQKKAARPPRNDQAAADAIEAAAQSIATMNPKDLTRLKDVASLRGDQRLLIYNRAKQINPNFSTAEVDRKAKMLDSFTNGKDGQQLQSFGTFLEHAGEASRITNEFRTTSIPLVNTPLNAIRSKFGDASYSQFIAALEPVRKEFEGFLLGGRALYGDDRKAAETILSDSSSPAQIQAALKQMGHTVKARQNEIGQRFKNTMGARMEEVLGPMSPEAIEGSRQIGLDMGGQQPSAPAEPAGGFDWNAMPQHK